MAKTEADVSGDAFPVDASTGYGLAMSPGQGMKSTTAPSDSRTPQSAEALSGTPQDEPGVQRITRTSWPSDPTLRAEAIAKVMPQALADYFGSTVVIAAKLQLLPEEVDAIIAADPALDRAQKVNQNARAALLEDVLTYGAITDKNQTTARFLLERMDPDRWAKKTAKQAAEERSPGMPDAPPVPVFKQTPGGAK